MKILKISQVTLLTGAMLVTVVLFAIAADRDANAEGKVTDGAASPLSPPQISETKAPGRKGAGSMSLRMDKANLATRVSSAESNSARNGTAAMSAVDDTAEYDCVMEPHQLIDVSSAVDGVLASISVERGDFVEPGEVLAQLESGVEQAAVKAARARAEMTGGIKSRQVSVEYEQRKKERFDELFAKRVIPHDAKDEAETQAMLAKMQLREARENKRLAQLELERAKQTLDLRTIRSPIKGLVAERFKSVGESVDEEPMVRLAELDPLNVEVILPAELFGTITVGTQAEVTAEFPGNPSYRASVSIVDHLIDAASGTFGVRLNLPNPDFRLPGGLKCKIRFLRG